MNLDAHDLLWCIRRLPKPLQDLLKKHPGSVFVAGGYIRSCITNDDISDIDIFAPSKDLAKAYAEEIKPSDTKIWETDNAFTVKGYFCPVQFIHRWTFSNAVECVKSFDFTIAKAAFWWSGEAEAGQWQSECHPRFYADLTAKRLIYTSPIRNEDAGGSMLRALKFYQRGFRIPLDSLGAVIARLAVAVDHNGLQAGMRANGTTEEQETARLLTAMLVEVDPNSDPRRLTHLPMLGDNAEVTT